MTKDIKLPTLASGYFRMTKDIKLPTLVNGYFRITNTLSHPKKNWFLSNRVFFTYLISKVNLLMDDMKGILE